MEKILFTATVDSHLLNFHIPYLQWFKKQGYEVHVASNGNFDIPFVDVKYNIPFSRSPYKKANYKAYKQLKSIITDNNYKLIHCHTPLGSVLTRLAARATHRKGTKVLYTAHGFHFYKGAPLINWLIYYPIEKWLARYTDCLLTINKEDYARIKHNFKAQAIEFVNGVGIDLQKFVPPTLAEKRRLRREYGYNDDDFILIYVAELTYRKHQDLPIKAVKLIRNRIPQIKLLLAGEGIFAEQYKKLVKKLDLENNIQFLGQRHDVVNLLQIADLAVSAARHEGLPVNVMEAMATGLPLVVSDCRGNRDLVSDGENGYVVGIDDTSGLARSIEKLYYSVKIRQSFREKNFILVMPYALDKIKKEMTAIYSKYLHGKRDVLCD